MVGVVDEREPLELLPLLQHVLQLGEGHAVPDIEHVSNHEVLDVDVVGSGTGEFSK